MTDRKTVSTINDIELTALYDERDRLRAGEEPGWDPLTVPTPGQWIEHWNRASAAERLQVAERIIANAETASLCFAMGHEQRLAEDRRAWVIVARVRDVVADMEQITGARHWARILHKVVDGEEPAASPAAAGAVGICELPHQTIAEEDACEQQRLAGVAAGTEGTGHRYLSTGCLHGDLVLPDGRTGHQYCSNVDGIAGLKKPAQCKFCAAPCICPCHTTAKES